jgi:hypothetical protein
MVAKKPNYARVTFYHCNRCDYVFPVRMKHCPCCKEQGEKVRLEKYHTPYKFSEKIEIVELA